MTSPDLDSFLAPRSIAVVGASSTPGKIGAVALRNLLEHGYDGSIHPINAGARQVQGLRAVPSLRDLDCPVDLAIFAIPAAAVQPALADAAACGVRNVVVFSGGFAETGEQGWRAQGRLTAIARDAGIRVLGPNCLGFMNVARSVYATFSPVVSTGLAKSGKVGIVSQSGAFGAYAYAMARERGIGLSSWITTGNESDIAVADCIEWMAGDPSTQVILAYLEGCRDGTSLRRALEAARRAAKPVVAVKVGRTALGANAAASHTAALAGDDAAYDALLRQHGAWRAQSLEDFFDLAHGLAVCGFPANDRVGLLTVSGGVGAMMADEAAARGLEVAPLPPRAQRAIRASAPLAATGNPVDLTGQVTAEPELVEVAARAMLGEAGHGSLVVFLAAFGATPAMQALQRRWAQELRHDFPDRMIVFSTLADVAQQRALEARGCLSFADPARAIRLLAAMRFLRGQRERPAAALPQPDSAQALRLADSHDEAQAMQLLREQGIRVVEQRLAASRDEAAAQARALGFPLVMKVLSPDIAHKTEVGGVVLNIADAAAAAAAYDDILRAVAAKAPGARIDGVLLAPMVRGGVECIVGVRRDPALGAVVMIGAGGVHAELLRDLSLRMAPVDHGQAHEMIGELRSARLLQGFRGTPAADRDALADVIVRVSRLALRAGDALDSMEINPLLVLPAGAGALALDAVVSTRGQLRRERELRDWVLSTLPLFEMARMRAATTPRRHALHGYAGDGPGSPQRWVNQFTHTRRLRGPEDREVVTPNNDTLFSNAWLDLSIGPLFIEVPEMGSRYWVLGFLDAWTNPWAYAGRRTTGGQRQRLFVHGPRWQGEVPAGMHAVNAPGEDVWVIGRILVDAGETDLPGVHALQDRFAIRRPDGTPALSRIDTLVAAGETDSPRADEYLRVVDAMLRRNPSPDPLAADCPAPAGLQAALARLYSELRELPQPSDLGGGWTRAVNVRTSFGADHLTRARVARNWIGTLGIDEAMYLMAEVDSEGRPLDGAQAYALRFPADGLPRVGAFWSITLYRRSDCLLVANPLGRHSIGDRTPGLRRDRDGALSLRIQAQAPGESWNWLPCPAGEDFYLVLRLYEPQAPHLDGTFAYPALQRLRAERA